MPEVTVNSVNDHAAEVMRRAFGFDRGTRPALPVENDSAGESWSTIRAPDDWRGFPVASTLEQAESDIDFRAKCRRMGMPASVLMTLDCEWVFVGQINPAGQLRQDRVDALCQVCRHQRNRNGLSLPIISMDQFKLQTATHHCYVWHGECSECVTPHWCHTPIMDNE